MSENPSAIRRFAGGVLMALGGLFALVFGLGGLSFVG